jgi:hypothetical protein
MLGPILQVRLQRLARIFCPKIFWEKISWIFSDFACREVVPFFQISLAELCPDFSGFRAKMVVRIFLQKIWKFSLSQLHGIFLDFHIKGGQANFCSLGFRGGNGQRILGKFSIGQSAGFFESRPLAGSLIMAAAMPSIGNGHFRNYPLTGHIADMAQTTRMTQLGH